ncbi:MAG: hypothetical protein JWP65_3559 [Ramlibacter sp.]|jgi:hypothetical protein|nr:hypothetical protein [Ramlibacter sp.]
MAASSSRASCSGHQLAPAATIAAGVASMQVLGPDTVKVAMRVAWSTCSSMTGLSGVSSIP